MVAPSPHLDAPFAPVPHRRIATWPVGVFIENVAVLADGRFALSIHNERRLVRVDRDGRISPWAALDVSPAGLIAYKDGVLAVGGEVGAAPHRVFQIHGDGAVEEKLIVPGSIFLNGFTPVDGGRAYAVDSLKGQLIEIDVERWSARIVLTDERLAKISDEPMLPGANGLKAGDDGLYITNTDRALVLRAPLNPSGGVDRLEGVAEGLRGDDLAIDTAGRLYITNHIHNTLIRLQPDGSERTAIAGPDEGMAGCTACAFHPDDPGALYITTTGGIIMPYEGKPQEAKLVRLEVDANGRALSRLG